MNLLCPKIICAGEMKQNGGGRHICKKCGLEVGDQDDWWNKAEQFQKEACIKVLGQSNGKNGTGKRSSNPSKPSRPSRPTTIPV